MKSLLTLLLLAVFALASGCESRRDEAIPAQPARPALAVEPKRPFIDPLEPVAYELPSGALATWRNFSGNKPALLLFSAHPLLEPFPGETSGDVCSLLDTGTPEEIARRGQLFVHDPAFFPLQTISVAIRCGLVAEVILALPLRNPDVEMALSALQDRMRKAGFLTEKEAAALVPSGGGFSGTVRGVPLRLVHQNDLPEIAAPVLLHLDLDYFRNLYVNEISTPAFQVLYDTAAAIRTRNYQTIAVTLSFSNQEIGVPLSARFLLRSMASLLRDPALLEQRPEQWQVLANALYLRAMYMESDSRELLFREAEKGKGDADFLYALATAYFQNRQAVEGFATLDKAIRLDPGYALEYLTLAETGLKNGQIEKALELFDKAATAFPSDPFIRLQLAETLLQLHQPDRALPILEHLATLAWSQRVYPEMPARITGMIASAKDVDSGKDPIAPAPAVAPEKTPR